MLSLMVGGSGIDKLILIWSMACDGRAILDQAFSQVNFLSRPPPKLPPGYFCC
jgi:hypothetical protein